MKILQVRELRSQAEEARRASQDQLKAAQIMLQAANVFAGAVSYSPVSGGGGGRPMTALQAGGLVQRPTLALVGEAGPEYVIPARKLENLLETLAKKESNITVHIYTEDGKVKKAMAESELFAAHGVRV